MADKFGALEKLFALHQSGALSKEEFEREKTVLLELSASEHALSSPAPLSTGEMSVDPDRLIDTDANNAASRDTKLGAIAALVYAAGIGFGIYTLNEYGTDQDGRLLDFQSGIGLLIFYALFVVFLLSVAWRFYDRKGLVVGCVTLALTAIEFFRGSVSNVSHWMFLGISIGLLRGVRGSWYFRKQALASR